MKNTRALLLLAVLTVIPIFAQAQAVDTEKVIAMSQAVAQAEGFGVPHTIPTRYHNPGNIRSTRNGHHYAGQVGLNHSGYVIFKNDSYGWRALREQLTLMASGQSAHYGVDMTITQVAKRYATNWRVWAKNVSNRLDVPPTTTLRAYFTPEEPVAPSMENVEIAQIDLSDILNVAISLPVLSKN
jgi:hypothetical protein